MLPFRSEAMTILWAVQLAKDENWPHIVIVGEVKNCFLILYPPHQPPQIGLSATPLVAFLVLKESFFICSFSWVKRECNARAHAAAKLSLSNFQSFCFNNLSIPNVLKTVCEVDCYSPIVV